MRTAAETWLNTVSGTICAWGLSRRKQRFLREFLDGRSVRFITEGTAIPADATLLLWGSTPPPPGTPGHTPIIRLEDGFIRSVGLGADLIRPLSWVLDSRGIYYDSSRPSDLEHLLQTAEFDAPLLERAAALRKRVVAEGVTKYNLADGQWQRPDTGTRVLLVPGQVESDAAIRFGAPGIQTNMELLQEVRRANPHAWLVYKPHPDVVAGLRRSGTAEDQAGRWCNEVVREASMGDLLDQVDELHLLTSLTGFEALLRGKRVVCYGQPFYAGWGLTEDCLPIQRRTRHLTLDELVAGALILYPRYVQLSSGRLATPEQALDDLLQWRQRHKGSSGLLRDIKRFFLRRIVGVN